MPETYADAHPLIGAYQNQPGAGPGALSGAGNIS